MSVSRIPRDTRVKTEDVINKRGVNFTDFQLKQDLIRGIYEAGYENPSPVQADSIPHALTGSDILARAKNGTGKTASYVIPILERIDVSQKHIQALVLVPARELTLQVSHVIKLLGKYVGVEVLCLVGGTSVADDILRIKTGPHVVVATTGRLLHIAQENPKMLSKCRMVVLDEADKLLAYDSIETVEEIIEKTPENRQLLLFSATFPASVEKFQTKWMKDNLHMVNVMDELVLKGVTQYYAYLEEKDKVKCLRTLFSKLSINQCMIFCNSVERTELLAKKITEMGASCFYIHSKMRQDERNEVFHKFRQGAVRNLVASDMCARGIDVQTVNVVINFDFPDTHETYLHRIGRSGRFGHLGLAINFITKRDRENLYRIESKLQTEITAIPNDIDKNLYCI